MTHARATTTRIRATQQGTNGTLDTTIDTRTMLTASRATMTKATVRTLTVTRQAVTVLVMVRTTRDTATASTLATMRSTPAGTAMATPTTVEEARRLSAVEVR